MVVVDWTVYSCICINLPTQKTDRTLSVILIKFFVLIKRDKSLVDTATDLSTKHGNLAVSPELTI